MPVSEKKHNIVFAGCVESGFFTAKRLIQAGIAPTAIISIDRAVAEKNKVSGYCDFFKLDCDAVKYRPESYSLKTPADISFFASNHFDLLVVLGWQRLIPREIIITLRLGGVTIHGSGPGLPKGRGRSPMNWAIIEGCKSFHLSLLTLSPDADAGNILDTMEFDILPTDTIRTLYYKNAYTAAEMMTRTLPVLLSGKLKGIEQDETQASSYPKRNPEDGKIDWTKNADEIERLIRAVTKPYPGAFSGKENSSVKIWGGQTFDTHLSSQTCPGTVVSIYPDGAFLVQTGKNMLLVYDYEGTCPREGIILT
jgi:methionyl-tRNA formyltransferase